MTRKTPAFHHRTGFAGRASLGKTSLMLVVSATTAAALISYNSDLMSPMRADAPQPAADRKRERRTIARGVAKVKETAAHLLHSGHDHMGVHLWGANRYKVVAPDAPSVASLSGPAVQKRPVYLKSLAGQTFRDLALHEQYAVAVTSSGDLIQWGSGYSPSCTEPERTLRGMDVADVALTPSKIYARTRSGKVLILPADKDAQHDTSTRPVPSVGWYWRLLGYHNPGVQYATMRIVDTDGKDASKKVKSISAGRNHLLALTTDGKALAACVDSEANDCGQLGSARLLETVAGSPRETTLSDHDILFDDTLKEIPVLRKLNISQLIAGDRHSLALTSEGRVLGWGNNVSGQLALGSAYSFPSIPTPTEAALTASYPKTARIVPRMIAAGGDTSYFVVERDDLKAQSDPNPQGLGLADGSTRRMYCDLLASGQGMNGQLGNGQWNSSGQAGRVKTVSGLTEFNESTQTIQSIPVESVSIASTHAAIVLGNALHDPVTKQYFGHDVFLVGHNADYQLGTGKRSNLAIPQHIGPLPYAKLTAEAAAAQGATGEERDETALASAEEGVDSGSRTHMPHKRLQLAPRTWNHKKAEERIVCGYGTTAVYWHVDP